MGRDNVSSVRHERTFRGQVLPNSSGMISGVLVEASWNFSNSTGFDFVKDNSLHVTLFSAS
jgi:hypothetical protein